MTSGLPSPVLLSRLEESQTFNQDHGGIEPEVCVDDWNRYVERSAHDVHVKHEAAAIKAVRDYSCDGSEKYCRKKARDKDTCDCKVCCCIRTTRELLGHRGCREQAKPITEG